MPAETGIILFAIRTAIRLGGQAREAYIDSHAGLAALAVCAGAAMKTAAFLIKTFESSSDNSKHLSDA